MREWRGFYLSCCQGRESHAKEERRAQRNEEKRREIKRRKREERGKRRKKRQRGSRRHKRRGTRANQIALICCASSKNVNARRPLVIQPCRAASSLSFPRAHPLAFPSPFGARDPSALFSLFHALHTVALICGFMFGFAFQPRRSSRVQYSPTSRENETPNLVTSPRRLRDR